MCKAFCTLGTRIPGLLFYKREPETQEGRRLAQIRVLMTETELPLRRQRASSPASCLILTFECMYIMSSDKSSSLWCHWGLQGCSGEPGAAEGPAPGWAVVWGDEDSGDEPLM